MGLGSAFSFNIWEDLHFVRGMTFFDLMDYVSNNILLPLGGVLIALFAGWGIDQQITRDQLAVSPGMYQAWRFVTRFIAPAAVFLVFLLAFF